MGGQRACVLTERSQRARSKVRGRARPWSRHTAAGDGCAGRCDLVTYKEPGRGPTVGSPGGRGAGRLSRLPRCLFTGRYSTGLGNYGMFGSGPAAVESAAASVPSRSRRIVVALTCGLCVGGFGWMVVRFVCVIRVSVCPCAPACPEV